MTPPRQRDDRRLRARRVQFVLICVACVLVAVIYVMRAVTRERSTGQPQAASVPTEPVPGGTLAQPAGPLMLFSNITGAAAAHYRAALAPIAVPNGPRALTGLVCERVHFAGGRGVCLGQGGGAAVSVDGLPSTHAYVFGSDFRVTHDISLGGVPSRVRVSPDGHRGAVTVFVVGHSYAAAGFSTATTLLDLHAGRPLGNLETFAVWRDGRRFQSVDFNFWGVTFAPDSDRFYATLASGGRTYLVQGSVSARRMETLRENVECPSASPDGTRLAFKKRMGRAGTSQWRFHVLDLATMQETALAEPRSIDDQIEWLDNDQVLYGDGHTIWAADAKGATMPRKFLSQAVSPVVLRGDGLGGAAASLATSSLTLPMADLDVSISSASEMPVEGRMTYTVTITNKGPADASMLKVDQLLAPGLTPIGGPTASNPGQGYGCSRHDDPQHLSCDTLALARGGVWTMSFTARASVAGTYAVHVMVSGAEADPDSGNDLAETRTTVPPAE